jgi:hypothetical protein
VFAQAIVKGAGTHDLFGTAYGEREGKFEGFKLDDANVQFDDTLLLIEPEAAKAYAVAHPPSISPRPTPPDPDPNKIKPPDPDPGKLPPPPKSKIFYGSVEVAPAAAKMRLVQIAEEIIAILAADPTADVNVRVELHANFPHGAQDQTKRAVSENAKTLGFKNAEWE